MKKFCRIFSNIFIMGAAVAFGYAVIEFARLYHSGSKYFVMFWKEEFWWIVAAVVALIISMILSEKGKEKR